MQLIGIPTSWSFRVPKCNAFATVVRVLVNDISMFGNLEIPEALGKTDKRFELKKGLHLFSSGDVAIS